MARYLDIHLIQPVPYNNLNRDDTGTPKTLMFGGAPRSRVSSQSWKRATRTAMESGLDQTQRSVRTRLLVRRIAALLVDEHGWSADAATRAAEDLTAKVKKVSTDGQASTTSVTLFFAGPQVADLVALAAPHQEHYEQGGKKKSPIDPDAALTILGRVDGTVAMFGRMMTDLKTNNPKIEAAFQVAHAFSTHAVDLEQDYWTVADDLSEVGETGAAHVNVAEYTAGVLYRYATINVDELRASLDEVSEDADALTDLVTRTVAGFITSMPTGKKSATAAWTLPVLAYVTVRGDQPVNLAAAFERPVTTRDSGHVAGSVDRLRTLAVATRDYLGPQHVLWSGHSGTVTALAPETDLSGLGDRVDTLTDFVEQAVQAALAPEPA